MVKIINFLLSLFLQPKKQPGIVINQPIPFVPKTESLIKKEEAKVSGKVKHTNNGDCLKCEEIFNRFPGFHQGLKTWFKQIQKNNPDAHIAAAGRGKVEQEQYLKAGTSKASYGKSAHNWNCAIDIFRMHQNGAEWPKSWFSEVIEKAVDEHNKTATFKITWYGKPGSKFYELPHCEVSDWKKDTTLKLVE